MKIIGYGVEFVASVVLDADGTAILGVIESEYKFYPEKLVIRFTENMTGIAMTQVSVGTNAPNYDNIASALQLLSVNESTARQVNLLEAGPVAAVASNAQIRMKVTHTTGSGGKADVSLVGFYQPTTQA